MKHLQTFLQISDYPFRNKERWLWVVKILVTTFCLWFIIDRISNTTFPPGALILSSNHLPYLLIATALMPVNWFMEIHKWRLSISEEKLTFLEGATAVLGGLALNWLLPFTLGDVGGRLANVKNKKRSAAILMILRTISLIVTAVYGSYAVLFYLDLSYYYFFLVAVIVIILALLLARIYGLKDSRTFMSIILISLGRYILFTSQFMLIIWALIPELPIHLIFAGVGWIFLFRSVIPSLFGNFGVREASALVFFEQYLDPSTLILLPCLLIWVINTVLPSLVGAALIFNIKVNIAQ